MEIPEHLRILVRYGTTYYAKKALNCSGCAFFDKTYRLLVSDDCARISCMPETDEGLMHLIYVEEPPCSNTHMSESLPDNQ